MRIQILVIGLLVSFLFSGCAEQDNSVIFGAVLPFTGSSAISGESSSNGLDLALAEINAQGGVNGRQIRIIHEDSQTKTDVGLSAFMKLKDVNNIKIVFTSVSGVALAVSPVANANKIIQMDVVAASPAYSSPNDYTFRTGVSAYFFAGKMADLLFERNISEVALLFVNTEYGAGYKEVFVDEYEKGGRRILITQSFNQDDTDFRTQILKIKNLNPKALVLISLQKETPQVLKQMDELDFDIPIYTDVYAAELTDNLGTRSAENIIYLKPKIDLENKENLVAKRFRENYLAKYMREPDFIAAQAYDGLFLIVEAMKKCGNAEDTECIKNNLYKIKDYQGAIGNKISFDINGDILNRPLDIMTIRNGEFVRWEET